MPPPHTVRGLAPTKLGGHQAGHHPGARHASDRSDLVTRERDERDRRNVVIRRTVNGALYLERLGDLIVGRRGRSSTGSSFRMSTQFRPTPERGTGRISPNLRLQRQASKLRGSWPGTPATRIVPVAERCGRDPTRRRASTRSSCYGERPCARQRRDGWAWVQAELRPLRRLCRTMPSASLRPIDIPTHIVDGAAEASSMAEADLKTPAAAEPCRWVARLRIVGEAETRGTRYLRHDRCRRGHHPAIICGGLEDAAPGDHTSRVAGRLLETPYLWGGRSGFGIDCSGLVQLCDAW
jgi:hypothetical protein